MPISYLEGNPADVYAINRLGSTFSDALIGMQANRIRQQQMMAQRALDAAYYQLAARKAAMEERVSGEDINQLRAQTGKIGAETKRLEGEEQRNKTDYQAGGVMADATKGLYGTDPTKNPDVTQFLRGIIAQNAMRLASSNPANIAKQSIMLSQAADPTTGRLIATDTPAMMNIPRGGTLFDVGRQQPVAMGQPVTATRSPDQMQNDALRALDYSFQSLNRPDYGDPQAQAVKQAIVQRLGGMGVDASGGSQRSAETFTNEGAARKAGKKTGDRVYLQGVGLVELE